MRETLMCIVDTPTLQYEDHVKKLSGVFDALVRNPEVDVSQLLWGVEKP